MSIYISLMPPLHFLSNPPQMIGLGPLPPPVLKLPELILNFLLHILDLYLFIAILLLGLLLEQLALLFVYSGEVSDGFALSGFAGVEGGEGLFQGRFVGLFELVGFAFQIGVLQVFAMLFLFLALLVVIAPVSDGRYKGDFLSGPFGFLLVFFLLLPQSFNPCLQQHNILLASCGLIPTCHQNAYLISFSLASLSPFWMTGRVTESS